MANAELAGLAALTAELVAAASAAQAAVVLEASTRGVIAESDHPRTRAWVEQSCRDAGVPVAKAQARNLHEVAQTCVGYDVEALRAAVTQGRIGIDLAGVVAKSFRRLKRDIEYPNWDALLQILIDHAAEGAPVKDFAAIEDLLIGQYGIPGRLDDQHERARDRRELTGFHRDRNGMLVATLRLDPASEAVFTAAINALSAPIVDEHGHLDPRSTGARRADALLDMVAAATEADRDVPGSGTKAKVVVTISLETLMSGLEEAAEKGWATTGFSQALSPSEARILGCDAQIIPAVLGAKSELLDLGHAKRLITPAQRLALQQRDQRCTFPGCTIPPAWCDGHHLIYWALGAANGGELASRSERDRGIGGPTDMDNLALLCRHHHTEVHRQRHRGKVTPDGVRWTRSDGSPIGNALRATSF
ncbi:HNH endonuclease signature motif containing protein [Agilicoccus flavus]|uniref:HNH endonuclease signature motif containing protein n=1 Tax=Agilicoccus flavus TaxID=2775968 RepID=UPI001CF6575A|nr:HNH endonuclease signature motif containing protein [Agilicoccus flavus]